MPLQYKLEYVLELLIKHNGVKKKVADELGKDPANMKKYWRLMRDKGLLDNNFNPIKTNGGELNG